MGCGVSRQPFSTELRPLRATRECAPGGFDCAAGCGGHPKQITGESHENGISSERPSPDGGSATKSDSPPPRFSAAETVVGGNSHRDDSRHEVKFSVEWNRSVSPVPGLSEYATLPLRHVHKKLKHNHRVFRICLTGGPCGGKSTLLTQLQAKMPQRTGYKVFCVPEAATLLLTGGMVWNSDLIEEQQLALLRVQIGLEDQFYNVAMASGAPSIVISDRGTMDGRAFCSEEIFERILRRLNVTLETLRDRYDAVIHLVTAASGAKEYYNLDNPSRYENVEEAVESDKKLRQVYVGHPMLRIIDNSTTFEEKMERGLSLVGQVIGQRFSMQNTSYYLVRHCPKELPVQSVTSTLTITLLCNSQINDVRLLIRREHPSGECMYFFNSIRCAGKGNSFGQKDGSEGSVTRDASPVRHAEIQAVQSAFMGTIESGQRVKTEQRISSREYATLICNRDAQRHDVVLNAVQFIHDDARYEVTTIVEPPWAAGKQALTLECDDQENATFPSFVKVDREVPIDSLSTAFLISHTEMGPLYTSLVYAPVFTRGILTRGTRADTDGSCATSDSGHRTPRASRRDVEDNADERKELMRRKKKKRVKRTAVTDEDESLPLQKAEKKADFTATVVEAVDAKEIPPNPPSPSNLGPTDDTLNLPPVPSASTTPPLPSGPPTANPRGAMTGMH
ncbi:hypothetical protein ECC02_000248 [Trypanosoma cruzi]|uniref:NadR/Ttd14 AAA domain-containing protein n=1 Tax=Trypanosoma cruzi TaxID=5693 RepID=A0A7J6YJ74_TRYCR|nr:hypothetical protein ECC02_000248 [Trypanosoma cruzi]